MKSGTYTLYRVVDSKSGFNRTVMHYYDGDGTYGPESWDFGGSDVFEVAKILKTFSGVRPAIESISKTDYKRKYGKEALVFKSN